jgi:hypothetical protein
VLSGYILKKTQAPTVNTELNTHEKQTLNPKSSLFHDGYSKSFCFFVILNTIRHQNWSSLSHRAPRLYSEKHTTAAALHKKPFYITGIVQSDQNTTESQLNTQSTHNPNHN